MSMATTSDLECKQQSKECADLEILIIRRLSQLSLEKEKRDGASLEIVSIANSVQRILVRIIMRSGDTNRQVSFEVSNLQNAAQRGDFQTIRREGGRAVSSITRMGATLGSGDGQKLVSAANQIGQNIARIQIAIRNMDKHREKLNGLSRKAKDRGCKLTIPT